MSEQKEVKLLTSSMAANCVEEGPQTWDEDQALRAIATGDAATYNTHTHVVVPRGEIEAKDARIAELEGRIKALESGEPFAYFARINNAHDLFSRGSIPPPDDSYDEGTLQALYLAQPAAAQRALEAAAKVCDGIDLSADAEWKRHYRPIDQGRSDGASDCADAIRAIAKELN